VVNGLVDNKMATSRVVVFDDDNEVDYSGIDELRVNMCIVSAQALDMICNSTTIKKLYFNADKLTLVRKVHKFGTGFEEIYITGLYKLLMDKPFENLPNLKKLVIKSGLSWLEDVKFPESLVHLELPSFSDVENQMDHLPNLMYLKCGDRVMVEDGKWIGD
jgi:hypothetical protein